MPADPENSPAVSETVRLQALLESGLLDSPPEPVFDQLIQLAARVLKVPVALISLVDKDRQFFKAQCGLPEPTAGERQTPLSHSFCQHVVNSGKNLIVEDARKHALVAESLAITDLGVIAYAGAPLRDADGLVLGSLCVIDSKPRKWTQDEIDTLTAIAQQVMTEIALRSVVLRQTNAQAKLRAADEDRRLMARLDRHDLRTPLNALLLNVQAALLLGEVNGEGRAFLEAALNNGKAITEMLDQMLDIDMLGLKGAGALNLRECDPAKLIAQGLGQVAPLATEKAISLTTNVESTRKFTGDEQKLVRVIVNLLANAVKFTVEGGRIDISVRDGMFDDKDSIYFSVQDNGIGIDDHHLGDIFTEGFRIPTEMSAGRSTGLGLTFCKRAIAAHSGHIWVESRKGEGSTFSFSIPLDD